MTKILQLNQGDRNSSRTEKIENSYRSSTDLTSMSSCVHYKNMPASVDEGFYSSDGEFSGYSDSEFSDVHSMYGDRFDEDMSDEYRSDEEIMKTLAREQDMESYDDLPRLQHPDDMELILPAREMPSIEEMNAWYEEVRKTEFDAKRMAWAVKVIENWWSFSLTNRSKQLDLKYRQKRIAELLEWKRNRLGRRLIKQLSPLRPFDEEYEEMMIAKKKFNDARSIVEEHFRMIQVRKNAAKATRIAAKAAQKAAKLRVIKKAGMNKNTEWHKARANESLAFKDKNAKIASAEGEGRRAQRKKRLEKEKKEADKLAERLAITAPVADKIVAPPSIIDDDEVEMTDEQKEQEAAEMADALARINRACVIKLKEKEDEEKQKKEEEEEKKIEYENENEFVSTMAKNMGIEIKPSAPKDNKNNNGKGKKRKAVFNIQIGKGLIDQAVDRRCETDEKYKKRCDAFNMLADKDTQAKVLKFTKLCRSVTQKKKCYHKDCRFAHSLDQLQHKDCRFGTACKFVEKDSDGLYINRKFGRTGKTCDCLHPEEKEENFCKRLGLKYTSKPTVTVKAAPVEIKLIDKPVEKTLETSTPALTKDWSDVVRKADHKVKVNEAKADMTSRWSEVVVKSLSVDEKATLYGKGATILGVVEDERDNTPILPSEIRMPWNKMGLGFSNQPATNVLVPGTTNVLVPGFNWVKGEVIKPPRERKKRWDVKPAHISAIEEINKIVDQEVDITDRVKRAKAKAHEINIRLAQEKEEKSWTKVDRGRNRQVIENKNMLEKHATVFRVPRAHGELALLSAINSGITNFSIEYTDA